MDEAQPAFDDLMVDAQRTALSLDGKVKRDGSKETAIAVTEALRVYLALNEYRHGVRMTVAQTALLQEAMDILRARLRFFGEPV